MKGEILVCLKTDRFIQTMLYGELFDRSAPGSMPDKGFQIYEDGTISYETREGLIREVEVTESQPGILNVKIIDVRSNDILEVLSMKYEKSHCLKCTANTIHAFKKGRCYCTECGTYQQ